MKRRIAILGLSGVGKSTLIGKIRDTVPLLHLQASALIKAEQAHREKSPDSSEALRTGAVIDNQLLMVRPTDGKLRLPICPSSSTGTV